MTLDVVGQDEGAGLHGDLRGVSELDDHVRVGVDEVAAVAAPQQRLRQDLVLGEADAGVELLFESALAPGALELAVEGLSYFESGGDLIGVAFDESPDELGIHLGEGH